MDESYSKKVHLFEQTFWMFPKFFRKKDQEFMTITSDLRGLIKKSDSCKGSIRITTTVGTCTFKAP